MANSSASTTPPTQTHSPTLPQTIRSQKIPPSSSISDSFSLGGVIVFAVLGNGFDWWGGGGGGFGICWSVVVLGSGFDYRFMDLLEIGLFTGFVGLIC